jgi:hypothetical protein
VLLRNLAQRQSPRGRVRPDQEPEATPGASLGGDVGAAEVIGHFYDKGAPTAHDAGLWYALAPRWNAAIAAELLRRQSLS